MGHTSAKDIYHLLGKKIDGLITRAPWNQTLFEMLKELYTQQEAEVLVRMSYSLSTFEQVATATKFDRVELQRILDNLCEKGLVFDILLNDKYYYIQSPMVVGIFEMTMMRTRGDLRYAEWAKLFHNYLNDSDDFYAANFKHGEKVSPMRVLPHEETIDESSFVEILDYEKARTIIENTSKFSIGLCSCRHEKLHLGEKTCNVPLETCSSFGPGADLMIRHGFAREVSKSEMLENLARSKELGLVLTADNVKKEVGFMCHCCGCCCNLLLGVSKHGYPNTVVTSTFIAEVNEEKCSGCEKCSKACPINAITMIAAGGPNPGKRKLAKVDKNICLGCGVCALSCNKQAIKLTKREQRVLHPENTFQRVILASLEKGTLQNQIFGEPQKISHKFLRGFVGGFLRIPLVKQSLMSDQLRSRFLSTIESAARKKGMVGI
ncbi:MAG TPA: 4Fe-4S dicluster domain-containing protein [Draconibacterium sp.]|nr:4Fe-4S dicluster domain-containing protein [Draconibacterium sp.]